MEVWVFLGVIVFLAILIEIVKTTGADHAPVGAIKTVMVKGNMRTDTEVQRYVRRGWVLVNMVGAGRKKVVLTFQKVG